MALLAPCPCPITKTLTVNFTGSIPPASLGYIVKWKVNGTSDPFHSVLPNPTSSPVVITGVPACQDILVVMQSVCDGSMVSAEQSTIVPAIASNVCGDIIAGSHLHNGYYLYAPYLLDVRGAAGDVTLTYDVMDYPNRISVYDASGSMIITSGWRGTASTSGPWGPSLSTPATGTMTFTPTSGSCFYKILVESVTPSSTTDAFTINISCPTGTTPVVPTITYVSSVAGYGTYTVTAPYLTTIRLDMRVAGTISNIGVGYTWIEGTLTSSTGPSTNVSSTPLLTTSGAASIGAGSSMYLDLTLPAPGYLTINTTAYTQNSLVGSTTGSINIINVNGTDYTSSPIATQAIGVASHMTVLPAVSLAVFGKTSSAAGPAKYMWYSTDSGLTWTILSTALTTSCASVGSTTNFPLGTTFMVVMSDIDGPNVANNWGTNVTSTGGTCPGVVSDCVHSSVTPSAGGVLTVWATGNAAYNC